MYINTVEFYVLYQLTFNLTIIKLQTFRSIKLENPFSDTQKLEVINNLPGSSQMSHKCPMSTKNLRAFEQMDKMMDDILVNEISSICPFNYAASQHKPPSSSKSDGHIFRTNK